MSEKITFQQKIDNLKNSLSNLNSTQRLLLVILSSLMVFALYTVYQITATEDVVDFGYEDFADVSGKSRVDIGISDGEEVNTSVIENPNTIQGQLAIEELKREQVLKENQGQSTIATFYDRENAKNTLDNINRTANNGADELRKQLSSLTSNDTKKPNRKPNWIDGDSNSNSSSNGANINSSNENKNEDLLANIPKAQLDRLLRSSVDRKKIKLQQAMSSMAKYNNVAPVNLALMSLPKDLQTQSENGSASDLASNSAVMDEKEFAVYIEEGSQFSIRTQWPIDSRINPKFIMKVDNGQLAGATVSCQYNRVDNILIPKCTTMTFKKMTVKISAIVLDPFTMRGIVDQDRDSENLLKTLGLFATGAMQVYGESTLNNNTQVTTSETSTIETQTLSEKELIQGSVATTVGSLQANALNYFNSPDILTIKENTPMLLTLIAPLESNWDVKNLKKGVDYL
jgi:hypothetical protein